MFKGRLLVKYFLSYLILLAAIFGALAFIFAGVFSFTRSQVENSVMSRFEQIGIVFESQMESLKTTVDLIHTNEYLTRFRLSNSDYMAYNGIKELKKLRASNSFIYDVFLSYKDGYVYSARGKSTEEVYLGAVLSLNEESRTRISSILKDPPGRGIYSLYQSNITGSQPAHMLCTFPLMEDSATVATVGFVVSSSTVGKTLEKLLGELQSGVRMTLPSGEFFMEVVSEAEASPFSDAVKEMYMYYPYRTEGVGFTFDMAIFTDEVLRPVKELQQRSYLVISATFILALLLSFYFSRRHYKPIKLLNKRAIEHTGRNILIDAGNEFDAILKVMDYEGLENRKLSQKVDEIGFILRQQSFELLLSGTLRDEERVSELIRMGEIQIQDTYTVMIVMAERNDGEKADMLLIAEGLAKLFGAYYITRIMEMEAAVFVVNLKDADPVKALRRNAVREACSRFAGHPSLGLFFCFSRVNHDPASISRAYTEAMVCAEQRLLSSDKWGPEVPEDNVLFFENLFRHSARGYHLEGEDLECLIRNLEKGDFNSSMALFEAILKKLHGKNLSPHALKFHYYDLLYRIFHHFTYEGMESQVLRLLESDWGSAEQFTLKMKGLFRQIIKGRTKEAEADPITQMVEYIDHNYRRSDLSLAALAERFQISPNYISRFFKEKTGESYISYLSGVRLKNAYTLVLESELAIHEIAQEVGYLDSVNFIKKFKKAYDTTPNELRLKHRQKTADNRNKEIADNSGQQKQGDSRKQQTAETRR